MAAMNFQLQIKSSPITEWLRKLSLHKILQIPLTILQSIHQIHSQEAIKTSIPHAVGIQRAFVDRACSFFVAPVHFFMML